MKRLSKTQYIDPHAIANLYIYLGDKEQAFRWLEKAYEEHSVALTSLKVNPLYDSLRDDARFTDLMRRVGLA